MTRTALLPALVSLLLLPGRAFSANETPAPAPPPPPVAQPTHAPASPRAPGKKPPAQATRHTPRGLPNTVDGRVWTSTLYTVSQPLGVEWGYGQVGAQVDAEQLFGTPVGVHVDGFVQQRLYQRPLRLGPPVLFGPEPWSGSGVRHPRYLTYDRLTEANLSVKTRWADVFVGRTIVPSAFQAMVDGVAGSAAVLHWGRVGAWAGLMPDLWHPRMWLDRDYRSLSGLFPADGDTAFTGDAVGGELALISRGPLRLVSGPLDGQTLFNLRFATAGASFSTRFPMFTSDTSAQLILWNPAARWTVTSGTPSPGALGFNASLPTSWVDAALVNHLMTFKPLRPLNFHFRSSWDAWGALRSLDVRRVDPSGNPVGALRHPVGFTDPLVDQTGGLRELLLDATFRGDWPFGLSVQAHHYQSLVTSQSWRFYQSDLVQPGVSEQFAVAAGNPGAPPGERQQLILNGKKLDLQTLAMVQRERLRASGWVSPLGFLFKDSSAQLYGEVFVEWRRDHPRLRPEGDALCMLDKDGDGVPEPYGTASECRVCQAQRVDAAGNPVLDAQGNPTYQLAYGETCGSAGANRLARPDDTVRYGGTVGLRDPTLYDSVTYDLSLTGMDGWTNRAVVARARVGALVFGQVNVDLGMTYELSFNQRYFTSDAPYNVTGVSKTVNGYYPRNAVGQAFVFDGNVLYRVAWGLTFEASYLMFFEEEPVVQDFIFGNGANAAGVVGYLPRDTHQAQQLFLLRASYRL
ncbi:MAG: hypothetical protein HY904_02750 [Deltaproteobacteria bacterium]|nr:hypothetical protein [Deltaproteobacteria bacterium]